VRDEGGFPGRTGGKFSTSRPASYTVRLMLSGSRVRQNAGRTYPRSGERGYGSDSDNRTGYQTGGVPAPALIRG
jgi:hypothetical protein